MISKKELNFVNLFARNVPFPGKDYAIKVMEILIAAYNEYEKNYRNKSYSLIFSNGEEISFEILTKNIAHLLGIDFKNLYSEAMQPIRENILGYSLNEKINSYDLLKRIIDRADDVIKNDSVPNKYKILNYYKVMVKCIIFSKITTFDKFNYGCIDFNREEFVKNCKENSQTQSSKFLLTASDEIITPYFMMGIRYDETVSHYIPDTLLAPENFTDYFMNQTLLLPIQVLVNNENDFLKLSATNEEKIQLLNMYKSVINTYKTNSFIDIYVDYESLLRGSKCLK